MDECTCLTAVTMTTVTPDDWDNPSSPEVAAVVAAVDPDYDAEREAAWAAYDPPAGLPPLTSTPMIIDGAHRTKAHYSPPEAEAKWTVGTNPAGFPIPATPPGPIVVPATSTGGASENQMAFLGRLVAERDGAAVAGVISAAGVIGATGLACLTKTTASRLIDKLLKLPKDPTKQPVRPNKWAGECVTCGGPVGELEGRIEQIDGRWKTFHLDGQCLSPAAVAAAAVDAVTEPGVYGKDGEFYRVRKGRYDKTTLWVEKIHITPVGISFTRLGRVSRTSLKATDRLNWKEAREAGVAVNACINCGKTLDLPQSVVAGYGQTCAHNNHWPYPTAKQAEAVIAGTMEWNPDD